MIPAKLYIAIVRQFAEAQGLPFWTWKEQRQAMVIYEREISKLN